MTQNKEIQVEPAFPDPLRGAEPNALNQRPYDFSQGMSKRFYAACSAMNGILASSISINWTEDTIIDYAYKFADLLLEKEEL